MKKVLIFVGSLNMNMSLAKKIAEQLEDQNIQSEIINLVELNLPMYDSLKEEQEGIPQKILELYEKMKTVSAYVFVSPEYNFSLTPVLVNTIAWISRTGDDFRELFTLKTIQLATHSGGSGKDTLDGMRTQFTRLGSIIMPREILTTYEKPLNEDSSSKILEQFSSLIKE